MFTLHHFQNLRAAQAFSDYLHTLQIKNSIKHDEFEYLLIIKEDAQRSLAERELTAFIDHPNDRKYLSASWETGAPTNSHSEGSLFNSDLLSNFYRKGGLVSHAIFALCVLVYLITNIGLVDPMQSPFAFFTHTPFDYSQSWRFIGPVFLHFSLLHIAFNLLWWWELAGQVERQQGKLALLVIFFVTGISSNLAEYYLVGPYFGGLSGVVYGLVGYCWLSGKLSKGANLSLPDSYFLFLLGWLALGFIDILPVNIANYAHLVGLLAGLILAGIYSLINQKRKV